MDQRLQNIMDNYDKMKIGADEQFKFRCTMCGRCCTDRDDILLNPKDLYEIAKYLSLKPEDIISRYCDTYIGSSSRIPIVRLKPQGPKKRCPLLNGSRCSVHNAKPTVCAMFPIGRCIKIDSEDANAKTDASKIEYIFVHPNCGDNREIHTVREWLETFDIPVEDDYFVKWQQTIAALAKILNQLEKKCDKDAMNPVWNITFAVLYLNYDVEQEFMPQFEANSKQIVQSLEELIKAMLDAEETYE